MLWLEQRPVIGRHICAMKFATEMCCDLCCKMYKCADNVRAGLNLKEIHKQKPKGVLLVKSFPVPGNWDFLLYNLKYNF